MRKKNDFSMLTLVAGGKKFGSNKLPVKKTLHIKGGVVGRSGRTGQVSTGRAGIRSYLTHN